MEQLSSTSLQSEEERLEASAILSYSIALFTQTHTHHFSLSLSCFHHFIGLYLLLFNIDSLQPYFPFPSKVVSVFSSTFPSTLFFSSFIAINISAVSHKVLLKSWKLQSKKKYTTHQWTNFMA